MIQLPLGLAKLASGIATRIGKMIGAAGDWLRADHNWWQVGCIVGAVGCMFLTFSLVNARQEIVLVQQTCSAQKDAMTAHAMADLVQSQSETATCRGNLQAEVGRREAVEALAKLAVQHAGKTEAQAAQDLAAWQKRYDQRPKTCDDALKALDALCPAL